MNRKTWCDHLNRYFLTSDLFESLDNLLYSSFNKNFAIIRTARIAQSAEIVFLSVDYGDLLEIAIHELCHLIVSTDEERRYENLKLVVDTQSGYDVETFRSAYERHFLNGGDEKPDELTFKIFWGRERSGQHNSDRTKEAEYRAILLEFFIYEKLPFSFEFLSDIAINLNENVFDLMKALDEMELSRLEGDHVSRILSVLNRYLIVSNDEVMFT